MSTRKQARRVIVLDTVIKLLASRGLEGVTHRAIDELAELPQGSSSYYFPKKAQLLVETSRHLAELLEKDCDELQVGFAETVAKEGVDSAVDYVAREVISYADNARDLFLARMELTLASARREELADVGEALTAAARRPIEFFLQLISEGHSSMPIETCAALIDGISLMYATGQGPKPTTTQIAAVFRSIL